MVLPANATVSFGPSRPVVDRWGGSQTMAMALGVADEVEVAVREHAQLVFRIAWSVLRNHSDAEDAVQEVFLRVVKHRHRLAEVDDRKAWIARIAWRVAVDRKRAQPHAGQEVAIAGDHELADEPAGNVVRHLAASGTDVEQIAAGREMLALVEQLIAGLPRELREVTLLATVQELNTRELAEVLEIPEATVRTRLFRARQLLREKLAYVLEPGSKASRVPNA